MVKYTTRAKAGVPQFIYIYTTTKFLYHFPNKTTLTEVNMSRFYYFYVTCIYISFFKHFYISDIEQSFNRAFILYIKRFFANNMLQN